MIPDAGAIAQRWDVRCHRHERSLAQGAVSNYDERKGGNWDFAMKTLTTSAMTIALLTVPAFSQGKGSAPDPKADAEVMEQKKRAEEIERDYKASVKRTKPQATEVPSDPWQSVRPSSSPPKPK
jgi:hypothetical protein